MGSEEFPAPPLQETQAQNTNACVPVGIKATPFVARTKLDLRLDRSMASKEDSLPATGDQTQMPSESLNLTHSFRGRAEDEAKMITRRRFDNSDLGNMLDDIPEFHFAEVFLGKRLGKGGFSNVDELRGILIGNHLSQLPKVRPLLPRLSKVIRADTVAVDDRESRQFIADHCRRNTGDARYAIKMLRNDTLESEKLITLGLCDLAIETRFLANLEHPNIIKIRAISADLPCSANYFVILDRLYDTLEERIEVWNARYTKLYSFLGSLRDRGGKKRLDFYECRIEKAFDLSAAVEHCHAYNVIHRDIKPENIGFDVRGDIKIFDFGMATELHFDKRREDGTYNLTGMAGSLRFMAPEVWSRLPYNSACDIYSLSLVLWAIVALQKPYSSYNWKDENHFAEQILLPNGDRPEIGSRWPRSLCDLLTRGWAHNHHARLSATEMTKGLRDELVRLRHGDESGIPDHKRRRSTFIFESRRSGVAEEKVAFNEFLDRSQASLHQS